MQIRVLFLAALLAISNSGDRSLANPIEIDGDRLSIVAFGTSLTHRGGWGIPLQIALSNCLSRDVTVHNLAMSGATTDWARLKVKDVIEQRPDVVLIELYANDAALHRRISVVRSGQNVGLVLDELMIALPHTRIVLHEMNPFHGTRALLRPSLSRYIEAHKAEALKRGLEIVDHGPAWSRLSKQQLESAIPDGSHPIPRAAVDIIVPKLMSVLGGPKCAG